MKECSAEGCGRPIIGRVGRQGDSYCTLHYQRVMTHGSINLPEKKVEPCGAEGCERPSFSRVGNAGPRYCGLHYKRVAAHGTIELPSRTRGICELEGCENVAIARVAGKGPKYCHTHYQQAKRGEAPVLQSPCVMGCGRLVMRASVCGPCRKAHKEQGVRWCSEHGVQPLPHFNGNKCRELQSKYIRSYYRTQRADALRALEDQGWACATCGEEIDKKTARVDHDHECGCGTKNGCDLCRRSLLCNRCNMNIGHAYDDPAILRAWKPSGARTTELINAYIAYLDYWHAVMVERGVRQPPGEGEFQRLLAELSLFVKNGGLSSASNAPSGASQTGRS